MAAFIGSVSRELVTAGRRPLLRSFAGVVLKSRRFTRGLRRRPVAVLYPGEKQEAVRKPGLQSEASGSAVEARRKHREKLKHGSSESGPAAAASTCPTNTEQLSVTDKLRALRFDKASPGDTRLAKMVSIARSRTFREQQNKVVLEGKRLICDALAAGATPQVLFFSKVERLYELPLDKLSRASLVKVKFHDIKIWSDLVTPQGVIAIFSKPDASCLTFPKDLRRQSVPLLLICDNVRDPGSLGTILRGAAAAGCDRVLLTQGCVDPWEPKVLRAAMGAHFRIPIFPSLDWDAISEHLPESVTVHVAEDASIPIRTDPKVQKPEEAKCDGYDSYVESDSDEEPEGEPFPMHVAQKPYYENWAQGRTALVISGETHGLSLQAVRLAEETDGYKLVVPTANRMQCLNSAMKASVLLFEGRKQLKQVAELNRSATRVFPFTPPHNNPQM